LPVAECLYRQAAQLTKLTSLARAAVCAEDGDLVSEILDLIDENADSVRELAEILRNRPFQGVAMVKCICGVDPGISGAIAFFFPDAPGRAEASLLAVFGATQFRKAIEPCGNMPDVHQASSN
jgi:hypothetical protein